MQHIRRHFLYVLSSDFPQVSGLDMSVQYQKFKPVGKMNQEEMMKFMASLAKLKKISVDWKTKLLDDDAWKIECQQPSQGQKK